MLISCGQAKQISKRERGPDPQYPKNCPVGSRPLPTPHQCTIQPAWFTERWLNQICPEVLQIGHLTSASACHGSDVGGRFSATSRQQLANYVMSTPLID